MPTIWSPEPAYFAFSACSLGNELLQGVQKVPQKSTRTTFPCSCLSETGEREPATGATLKSGAGLPTRPPAADGVEETAEPAAPATHAAWLRTTASTAARRGRGDERPMSGCAPT